MHHGLVVVRCVLIGDEVIIIFVEVVFKSCREFVLVTTERPCSSLPYLCINYLDFSVFTASNNLKEIFLWKETMEDRVAKQTWCDLVQPDIDIVVPVRAGLLMVKPQSVEQLMLDHGLVVTARPQRQDLTILLDANVGVTPMTQVDDSK